MRGQYWRALIVCLSIGCQKEVETVEPTPGPTCLQSGTDCQPVKSETPSEPVKEAPKAPRITCNELSIPSWEFMIAELTDLRCTKCHNERIAFEGIFLKTYQDLVKNKDAAKARIEANNLTEPLNVLEQRYFLDFFKNGMPEKESDCAQPTNPSLISPKQ